MTSRLLFVSNGVGEDLIAARIIGSLPQGRDLDVAAYPLVGAGLYPPGVTLLDPRRDLPSGGFSSRAESRGLGADLRAGILGLWRAQRRTLAGQRGRFTLVVAVGDVYCLWMAARAARRVAFVATADSARYGAFGPLRRWVLRGHARTIFARDPETAAALTALGLRAVSYGNVMMDQVETTGETFGVPPGAPVVTLLPGSRRDAPQNAVLLAHTAAAIAKALPETRFLLAIAPTLGEDGVRAHLETALGAIVGAGGELAVGPARLRLTRAFADAVARSAVVVGMAGTAHEQAAGMSRPVVAFPGRGAQFGPAFLHMQHRLLGDALVATQGQAEAAAAVVRLLRDPDERQRRGAIGRERMGPPGGARRIAGALAEMAGA